MTKRRVVLILVLCCSIALLAASALSQTRRPNRRVKPPDAQRRRNMTPEEEREAAKWRRQRKLELERRQKEAAKRHEQWKLERAQKNKELAKEGRGPLINRKQRTKEVQKRAAERRREWDKRNEEAGGCLFEKFALGATEEQWKRIKPKLEKVRLLRDQARSVVGVSLGSSTGGGAGARANAPAFRWKTPWKDKAPGELTEAQKLTKQLIALVERKDTTPEQFRRTMEALRKARSEEPELKRQLSEAQQELREILTTRQEAALVLMARL